MSSIIIIYENDILLYYQEILIAIKQRMPWPIAASIIINQ